MRDAGFRAPAVAASRALVKAVPDDQSLAARMADGDREAIGALYDLYAPVMMAVAVKMLRARREAQDLVHDVFLEAWLHAGEYDPEKGSLRSWLLLRLRSRALDRLGTVEATRTRSLDQGAPVLEASPVPTIEQADQIGLREAIAQLDTDVREILELTYFRGFTAQAIADQMSIPLGTVRSRLARGLRALRIALEHPDRGSANER